jgi:RHS repeat-associated protein
MPKTTYVWDELSDNVIEEYEDGVLSVSYTHEPGLYGNLLSQHRNGVTSYFHYDGRGDTVALTDDSGDVTDTKEYDAWGNVIASTGSTVTRYTFGGRNGYQTNTNTIYVRARSYFPRVARWLSIDPMLFADGENYFLYVKNGPLTASDPTGTCSCCCCPVEISLSDLAKPNFVEANSGDPSGFPKPAPFDRLGFGFSVLTVLEIVERRVEPGESCKAEWLECSNTGANLGQKPFSWTRIDPSTLGLETDWKTPPPSECPTAFRRSWSDQPTIKYGPDALKVINFLFRVKGTTSCGCDDKELKFHFEVGILKTHPIDPTKTVFDPKPAIKLGWHPELEAEGCSAANLPRG